MHPKDITAIAIKFFGIYLLVNVVLYFPTMILSLTMLQNYGEEKFNSSIFILVVGTFILLGVVVSFVLIKLANSIAARTPDYAVSHPAPTEEFLLQILGIYFIITGLSAMPGFSLSLFKAATFDSDKAIYGVGYAFQVLVGCYLLIKPVVWGKWLTKLRGKS